MCADQTTGGSAAETTTPAAQVNALQVPRRPDLESTEHGTLMSAVKQALEKVS
jgi:hypothetical protein